MHTLLGFDLRRCGCDYLGEFWLNEHRREYLLRSDVAWPLSVDVMVWPSFFDLTTRAEYRSQNAIGIDPVTTIQLATKLWDDRAAMEQAFREHVDDPVCVVEVAIELCLDGDLVTNPDWNFLDATLPVVSDLRDWTPVGYDVADRYLLSGLMNCGYAEEDRGQFMKWSTRLNGFGLFDHLEDAALFRDVTNQRVPDHAPFFVYRLLTDVTPEKLTDMQRIATRQTTQQQS